MISVMASRDHASPQTVSSAPQPSALRYWPPRARPTRAPLPGTSPPPARPPGAWPPRARPPSPARVRLMTTITIPRAATVKPWSSLTNTSGSAHSAAARTLPRSSADSEQASGRAADRDDRDRGEQGLGHEQGGRAGEDQEYRGDQADDRLEVVAEQVEAGPADVHHRGSQVSQLPDVLGEDAQVPRAGGELEVTGQRDRRVGREHAQGDQPRHPVGPAGPMSHPGAIRHTQAIGLRLPMGPEGHRRLGSPEYPKRPICTGGIILSRAIGRGVARAAAGRDHAVLGRVRPPGPPRGL